MGILDDIFNLRGDGVLGNGLPLRFMEHLGGSPVHIQWWEPDPDTFAEGEYYYNSRENALFQRVSTTKPGKNYVWKRLSERR